VAVQCGGEAEGSRDSELRHVDQEAAVLTEAADEADEEGIVSDAGRETQSRADGNDAAADGENSNHDDE